MQMVNDKRALALGLCAVVLWSTVATAFKLALEELSVLQLLGIAALSSASVLTAHLAIQGQLGACLKMVQHHWLECLLMGTLNPCVYYRVLLTAYDRLPAQQAQTINYTWAITLALFSIPVLKQRLSGRDWLAGVLGYLGALIIATKGQPLSLEFTDGLGVVLALASTFLWAGFWLLNARSQHLPEHALTGYFLCSLPLLAALIFWESHPWPAPGVALAAGAYVGVFEMGLTWLLWSQALRYASNVSRVGNLIFLAPILSLFLIATVLDEAIHPATVLGFALILPGIFLQNRRA